MFTRFWFRHSFVTVAIALPATLAAQESQPQLETRTIQLRNLRATDAARLVSPYVRSARGGVYEAGDLQAITVVESPQILARIDSLIRENDRTPAVLVFRFQLITANDTPGRDAAIASIDSTLRGLFRFKGYHLLGEGTTSAGENETFSMTIAGGEERFALGGDVVAVRAGTNGSARLRVRLARATPGTYEGKPMQSETLLSTGLTVPIGQTIVLGSAAPGGANQALILTVRPEIASGSMRTPTTERR
jgi:hypothetical protein